MEWLGEFNREVQIKDENWDWNTFNKICDTDLHSINILSQCESNLSFLKLRSNMIHELSKNVLLLLPISWKKTKNASCLFKDCSLCSIYTVLFLTVFNMCVHFTSQLFSKSKQTITMFKQLQNGFFLTRHFLIGYTFFSSCLTFCKKKYDQL